MVGATVAAGEAAAAGTGSICTGFQSSLWNLANATLYTKSWRVVERSRMHWLLAEMEADSHERSVGTSSVR
jgi:hypothetical protein